MDAAASGERQPIAGESWNVLPAAIERLSEFSLNAQLALRL